jgi:hypothetical protein
MQMHIAWQTQQQLLKDNHHVFQEPKQVKHNVQNLQLKKHVVMPLLQQLQLLQVKDIVIGMEIYVH